MKNIREGKSKEQNLKMELIHDLDSTENIEEEYNQNLENKLSSRNSQSFMKPSKDLHSVNNSETNTPNKQIR